MKLDRWQMTELKNWNGPLFDPEATLKALFKTQPEKIRKNMVKLNAIYSGRTLENTLEELGVKYVDTLNDFYYEIIASSRRNVQLVEARVNGVVVTPGSIILQGGAVAELVFGEDYFFDGEVIVGEKNEKYPVRVIREPEAEGDNVVYTVEAWGLPNGIPSDEFVSGKKFSVEYAPAARGLSRSQGGVRRPSTAKVRGMLSTIRIDHKVAGDVDDYAVLMGFPALDAKGNETTMTVLSSYEDWLVTKEFSEYKNKALAYGTTNVDDKGNTFNIDGKSGRKLTFGPGLRQQTDNANSIFYNFFSLGMLESVLQQMSYNKLGLNERVFDIDCGQGFASLFNKAVLATVSGWQVISQNNPAVIQKVTSELHSNAFSAGFQFTEFLSSNNVRVKLNVQEHYDDPVRNKILMPGTQLPAESFRGDIRYMGTKEDPNIQKLMYAKFQKHGGEQCGYSSGFRNPFTGEDNVQYMSTDEDSATITKFTHLGVAVYNKERCVALIPKVLE